MRVRLQISRKKSGNALTSDTSAAEVPSTVISGKMGELGKKKSCRGKKTLGATQKQGTMKNQWLTVH